MEREAEKLYTEEFTEQCQEEIINNFEVPEELYYLYQQEEN